MFEKKTRKGRADEDCTRLNSYGTENFNTKYYICIKIFPVFSHDPYIFLIVSFSEHCCITVRLIENPAVKQSDVQPISKNTYTKVIKVQ